MVDGAIILAAGESRRIGDLAASKAILPLAEQHLTADDWREVDAAFLGHTDPMLGADASAEYQALFRRIVNLAPPPIGLGPTP